MSGSSLVSVFSCPCLFIVAFGSIQGGVKVERWKEKNQSRKVVVYRRGEMRKTCKMCVCVLDSLCSFVHGTYAAIGSGAA